VLRAKGWTWPKLAAATGFSIPALGATLTPERWCWSILERAVSASSRERRRACARVVDVHRAVAIPGPVPQRRHRFLLPGLR
jgi:hypothetical protein